MFITIGVIITATHSGYVNIPKNETIKTLLIEREPPHLVRSSATREIEAIMGAIVSNRSMQIMCFFIFCIILPNAVAGAAVKTAAPVWLVFSFPGDLLYFNWESSYDFL